jgi:phenylacetate-CoA ligase
MRPGYRIRCISDVGRAFKQASGLEEQERWPSERLTAFKQDRLDEIVRHAVKHSRFYRDRLGGLVRSDPVPIETLPVLTKQEMMDGFDEMVTDSSLRRDDILAHLGAASHDELYLGRYRAMTTSGSSGLKGLFVYDRPEWVALLGQFFRYNAMMGVRPRLPRRLRIAAIGGASPTHMTNRVSETVSIGAHRVLKLAATLPIDELVQRLNAFQPQYMNAYPSIALALADAQIEGRLQLNLVGMSTSSELRPKEATDRMIGAFGVQPYDLYGTTEGLWGCECDQHDGIHLFEDSTLVENVDADNNPVPRGTKGSRLLVTNLTNRVQPIIRLELADAMTFNPDPCPCGRTLVRAASILGRTDDILEFPGGDGGTVKVHPFEFGVVTRDPAVRQFQVVRHPDNLEIRIVAAEGADADTENRIQRAVSDRLVQIGIRQTRVVIQRRDELERSLGGKVQLVIDRAASVSTSATPDD